MTEPALTPEEWERWQRDGLVMRINASGEDDVLAVADGGDILTPVNIPSTHRQQLAALALYGQPFGFTREDVELLREIAGAPYAGTWQEPAASLLARVESLLPPAK